MAVVVVQEVSGFNTKRSGEQVEVEGSLVQIVRVEA